MLQSLSSESDITSIYDISIGTYFVPNKKNQKHEL